MLLPHLDHIWTSSVIYYWTDARQHGIYLFYIVKKHTTSAFFILKSLIFTRRPAFAHFGRHENEQIDVSFLCVCPLSDDKLRHNIVKVAVKPPETGQTGQMPGINKVFEGESDAYK